MTAVRPADGCTKCDGPTAWVSLYTGPRCDAHKPEFDPLRTYAVLDAGGWRAAA